MSKKRIWFEEDKSWELSLPNGDTLHRINVYVGKQFIDEISMPSKYVKYFVGD
jgi:hypothetical protein